MSEQEATGVSRVIVPTDRGEQAQPCRVLHTDYAHEEYVESQLLEAASVLQEAALILGSHHIRRWFDETRLARAQGDLLHIQVQILAKLQRLNARAINDLYASQGEEPRKEVE